MLIDYMPKLMVCNQLAKLSGDTTYMIWTLIILLIVGCLFGGLLLVVSLLGLVLIEGTYITVDAVGITVAYTLLPRWLATYFGAGYIPWNKVVKLEKRGVFFVLYGDKLSVNRDSFSQKRHFKPSVKFILVHELERLILYVLEYSHNITLS